MGGSLLVQLIGFVALALSLSVYQVNKRGAMLSLDLGAATLWALHFALLGAWTGAAMNTIGATRNLVYKSSTRHWAFPATFVGLFGVGTGFAWWLGDGPLSLLPLTGMIAGTLAFWQQRPTWVRVASLVSAPMWLTYNAIRGSVPGILIEVVLIISPLIGLYRFDLKRSAAVPDEKHGVQSPSEA